MIAQQTAHEHFTMFMTVTKLKLLVTNVIATTPIFNQAYLYNYHVESIETTDVSPNIARG